MKHPSANFFFLLQCLIVDLFFFFRRNFIEITRKKKVAKEKKNKVNPVTNQGSIIIDVSGLGLLLTV